MSDTKDKPLLSSKEIADRVYDLGEEIALEIELIAQERGLDVPGCVLLIPSIVSTMLRRLTKDEPGSLIRARESIFGLIKQFTDIDEHMREKRRH